MPWPIKVQGREVDEEIVRWLSSWIAEHAHWGRRKLAGELCVLGAWRDGGGRAKDFAARSFLLKMEERGWIVLPPLREGADILTSLGEKQGARKSDEPSRRV